MLGRISKEYNFPPPYVFRALEEDERICFSRDDEVGVYCGFFTFELRFPLDKDVEALLIHYKIPLCQYFSMAIRAMIAFLSLIHRAGVSFSIGVFATSTSIKYLLWRFGRL